MSIEGRVEVIERIVREEGILLKEFREKLEHYKRSVPALEESLKANIKKLEELKNEARKG